LVAFTQTSGRKVAQHLGLSRRCVLNYKQWRLFINNGDLDFWSRTTKRQWLDALSLKVKVLYVGMVDHGDYHISWSKEGLQKKIGGKTNCGTSHPLHASL
jgi:hypothetical protein